MKDLDLTRATRKNIIGLCEGLTNQQLNRIPEGFNNNLIWNAGHVVATMELLAYALSGQRTPSDKEFINLYRKGTRPERDATAGEIEEIMQKLLSSLTQLEKDLETLDFSDYKTYETSYGVTLASITDALVFNNMHEAMHIGSMLALKKFV